MCLQYVLLSYVFLLLIDCIHYAVALSLISPSHYTSCSSKCTVLSTRNVIALKTLFIITVLQLLCIISSKRVGGGLLLVNQPIL